ncbi:unnamed protein product [Leuciscus chuanchicus]
MSESGSQQERLQAIASSHMCAHFTHTSHTPLSLLERRKRQTEIENKKRQLEDDRRQLQHLKSKALRERWLLDGAPSAGPEEDETTKQLREDEAKTRGLEETILRLERELEELETGLSATSTKENLSDVVQEVNTMTVEKMVVTDSVKGVKGNITISDTRNTSNMPFHDQHLIRILSPHSLKSQKQLIISYTVNRPVSGAILVMYPME